MSATGSECPRCGAKAVTSAARSAVAGVWELLQCDRCLYTWRTTEPARRSQRDAYPEAFMLTDDDLRQTEEIPQVPPLLDR